MNFNTIPIMAQKWFDADKNYEKNRQRKRLYARRFTYAGERSIHTAIDSFVNETYLTMTEAGPAVVRKPFDVNYKEVPAKPYFRKGRLITPEQTAYRVEDCYIKCTKPTFLMVSYDVWYRANFNAGDMAQINLFCARNGVVILKDVPGMLQDGEFMLGCWF